MSEKTFSNWKPFINGEKCSLFYIFDFKLFINLSWISGHVGNGLIRKIRLISNLMTSNLVNKQLQDTYWPISQEVKPIIQETWSVNVMLHENIFLEKSYTKCGAKTISDPFLNVLQFAFLFSSWGLSKYIESKMRTTCFYFMKSFLKDK